MTGKGRGRGWLNLEKSTNCEVRPGEQLNHQQQQPPISPISPTNNYYERIVHAISHFNDNDDGILLNQKFRYVKEVLSDVCTTRNDVENAMEYVYNKALSDSMFVSKFIKFVSLKTFQDFVICYVKLRYKFVTLLQDSYENSQSMQTTNPQSFRNAVKILTGFYEKATMTSGSNYLMLAPAIMHCLLMLLDSEEQEDIELFTTQLYACGPKFADDAVTIQDLTIKMRTVLTSNSHCKSENAKLWLLLGIDLANNEFRVLSSDLLNFYQMKLGSQDLFNFKKPLTVECTSTNNKLNEYSSDVNVLEIDTNLTKLQVNSEKNHVVRNNKSPNSIENGDMYWNSNKNNTQMNKHIRPKHSASAGRPILGAGARINATNNSDNADTGVGNWAKDNSPEGGKNSRKSKGWEHDDRFETDYN